MMRAFKGLCLAAAIVAMTSVAVAHEPPGETFFLFQFPLNAVPVMDGDISDWDIVPDLFWIDMEGRGQGQLQETVRGVTDVDLADINAIHIPAWNAENNRVYFMSHVVDEFLHNSRENFASINWDDDAEYFIDADHSGGSSYEGAWMDLPIEEGNKLLYTTAQTYQMMVPPLNGYWIFVYRRGTNWWLTDGQSLLAPAYLDAGFKRIGETGGPGQYFYEMMVTPWERIDHAGPDASTIVDLDVGMVIHLGVTHKDYDLTETYEGSFDFPYQHSMFRDADLMADFELLPVDLELFPSATAVETDTWGRIKSKYLLEE